MSHFQDTPDIIFHRQLAKHRSLLRQISDTDLRPFINRIICNIEIIQINMPLIGGYQSGRHIESRCLSCAIRAQQPHDFPLCNIYRHMVHNRPLTIFLYQIFGSQHHIIFRRFQIRLNIQMNLLFGIGSHRLMLKKFGKHISTFKIICKNSER